MKNPLTAVQVNKKALPSIQKTTLATFHQNVSSLAEEANKAMVLLGSNNTSYPICANLSVLTDDKVATKTGVDLLGLVADLKADYEKVSDNADPVLAEKIEKRFAMFANTDAFLTTLRDAFGRIGLTNIFEGIDFLAPSDADKYQDLANLLNKVMSCLQDTAYLVGLVRYGVPATMFTVPTYSTLLLTDMFNLFGQTEFSVPNGYKVHDLTGNGTCDIAVLNRLLAENYYSDFTQKLTNVMKDIFVFSTSARGIQNYTDYGNSTSLITECSVDNVNGVVKTFVGHTPFGGGENQFDNAKGKKPSDDSALVLRVSNLYAKAQNIVSRHLILSDLIFNEGKFCSAKFVGLTPELLPTYVEMAEELFYHRDFFKEINENSKRACFDGVGSFSVAYNNGGNSASYVGTSYGTGLKYTIESNGLTALGLTVVYNPLFSSKKADIANISVAGLDTKYRTADEAKTIMFFKATVENKGKKINQNVQSAVDDALEGLDALANI